MTNGSSSIVIVIVTSVFNTIAMMVNIADAIFISKYDDRQNECRISLWLLSACFINCTMPVFSTYSLTIDKTKTTNHLALNIIEYCCCVIITIWSSVTYYFLNSVCHNFWDSPDHYTWILIRSHLLFVWINIGLLCFITTINLCYYRYYRTVSPTNEIQAKTIDCSLAPTSDNSLKGIIYPEEEDNNFDSKSQAYFKMDSKL